MNTTAIDQNHPVDLTNCDAEQIQYLGCVQPHAFLIEVSPDWLITRVSANIADFLPTSIDAVLGRPAAQILGAQATHEIRGQLQLAFQDSALHYLPAIVIADQSFDVSIHRRGEAVVIEGERHVPGSSAYGHAVQPLIMQLRQIKSIDRLCAQAARQVRALSGFDRVMVYRFQPDGSGEVVAETKRVGLPAYKGLRYPVTDIPKQARALYERNTIRLIADVAATPVPIIPARDPAGAPIDLSMAASRAVSSIHIEYLRNMDVAASMSISILVGGKLWGLIACHHRTALVLPLPARTALEFFGYILSSLFDGLIHAESVARKDAARALHVTILNALSSDSSSLEDLFTQLRTAQTLLQADGFATFVEGRLRVSGAVPDDSQTLDLMQFLNRTAASRVYAVHALASVHPEAAEYAETASGVLAVPVSRKPRDWVLFFRRELIQKVVWAGNPDKSVQPGDGRISPRKSFEAWRETVRAQSAHWTEGDLEIAEALRVSLIEVMLQVTDRAEKQRKISNDQQDLLIAELNHRVRNILNLIVGLVRQCSEGATSVRAFAHEISSRVHALARAHDQLTSSGWGARSVSNMIRVEGAAYLADKADRIAISGDDVYIQPDAFATLALVMHELITNAVKYGAFRDTGGAVQIHLERNAAGLAIAWREQGGGPVHEPTRRGFGSTIIERAIPHELSGTAEIRFEPDGLRARLTIPAQYLADPPADALHETEAAPRDAILADHLGGNILLVEDNLLIALETEDALYTLGAEDVHIAATTGAALAYLRDARPDFAVLDYNLGREQSVPIAERLAADGILFVFASGYGDSAVIDPRFRDRPIIAKPYTARALLEAYNAARKGA